MSSRRTLPILLVGAVSLLLGSQYPSWAVPAENLDSQIPLLENRYFFHAYAHDPIEKRIERLELLLFGASQEGTSEERFARLKQTVAERDKASAAKARAAAAAPTPSPSSKAPAAPSGSAQYPILNTLEWRALKKTYPQESLDTRLGRLETQLFGQPATAMAYADRVDRLNRVLGVGVDAGLPSSGPRTIGPMPKAGRGSQQFGWSAPLNPGEEALPGFGGGRGMGAPFDLSNQFAEIFRQMDQQMEQMMRMPQGSMPPGTQIYQFEFPKRRGPSTPIPIPSPRSDVESKPKVPPYYDPNSI